MSMHHCRRNYWQVKFPSFLYIYFACLKREKRGVLFFTFSENGLHNISTDEVGNTAAFLASPLASAITGSTIYVDNGLNTMGLALDSPTLST